MADFLLELFSEEIPARMQPAAAKQLGERFAALLAEAGLRAEALETHATPRRLALLARGLPEASAATAEERRGPRADAPAAAIEGFLKSTGLTREQLEERDTGKGLFLFATLKSEGRPTAEILAERLPALIAGFQWPKSQRWGAASASTASPRWVRPLRGIVALLDGRQVPFEALGLKSGRETFGHRFMGPRAPIRIEGAGTYAQQLREAFVILSADERVRIIREGAERAAAQAGLRLRPDEALEAENAGLTEWPVPLLGRFDPAYLEVPPEIIALTMRTNQKYFALEDAEGRLAPGFVCVANLVAPDGGATIVAGNERVLSARLADARFFWEQDVREVRSNGFDGLISKLDDIVFHEKIGSLGEKVRRTAFMARFISGGRPIDADPGLAERAAWIAKADLVSATVGEFPELQGVIGRYLANIAGENTSVSDACRDHYLPIGANDDVPSEPVSVAVGLADRLDTLVTFFSIDERPTGSRDPFALRRAALATIALILDNQVRMSLLWQILAHFTRMAEVEGGKRSVRRYVTLIDFVQTLSENERNSSLLRFISDPKNWDVHGDGAVEEKLPRVLSLLDFFADRLKVQQREAGVRHDLIDAVFALGGEDDLVRLLARVKALQAFVETDDGRNLLAGYKRAANILRIEEKKDGRVYALDLGATLSKYVGETEKNLARLFVAEEGSDTTLLFDEADALLAREDFEGAMKLLATLRAPVDAFFDGVVVNDPDPETRARRLGLLAGIRDVMHKVADFSKIEG